MSTKQFFSRGRCCEMLQVTPDGLATLMHCAEVSFEMEIDGIGYLTAAGVDAVWLALKEIDPATARPAGLAAVRIPVDDDDRGQRMLDATAAAPPEATMIRIEGTAALGAAPDGGGPRPFTVDPAYSGGVMLVPQFELPVVVDLAGLTPRESGVMANLDHVREKRLGHVSQVSNDGRQLALKGLVSAKTPHAEEFVASSDNGYPWAASIEASIANRDLENVPAGKTAQANGKTFKGPIYVARRSTLYGVAMLSHGADPTARAIAAEEPEQTPPQPNKLEAERKRLAKIDDLCAGNYGSQAGRVAELKAEAVEGRISIEYLEAQLLQCLRQGRPEAPAIHSSSHELDCTKSSLAAGLMLRCGIALDSPHFQTQEAVGIGLPQWLRMNINAEQRARALELGHRFACMSLIDLARECVRLDGKQAPHNRGELLEAAFSGGSLTDVMTTNYNAKLLTGYMEAPDSTREWTQQSEVLDFKQADRPMLTKTEGLEPLPPGQSASHISLGDRSESYRVHRFARQGRIDEQDMINDRLNALQEIPKQMGEAAARTRPDLVYSVLLANDALQDGVALFHADHGNLATPNKDLTSDNLKAAITAIGVQQEQVGDDKNKKTVQLNLKARWLIIPVALQWTADNLINSALIVVAGTAGTVTQEGNRNSLLMSRLQAVTEARLDNGVTDPYSGIGYASSATDWYLAAQGGPTIEVGYLAGTGFAPRVRTSLLTQGSFGICFDVTLDIGAKAMGYRCLYKAEGS